MKARHSSSFSKFGSFSGFDVSATLIAHLAVPCFTFETRHVPQVSLCTIDSLHFGLPGH